MQDIANCYCLSKQHRPSALPPLEPPQLRLCCHLPPWLLYLVSFQDFTLLNVTPLCHVAFFKPWNHSFKKPTPYITNLTTATSFLALDFYAWNLLSCLFSCFESLVKESLCFLDQLRAKPSRIENVIRCTFAHTAPRKRYGS